MLISIHDVPRDERHLLFCSRLNHDRRSHRHKRRQHSPGQDMATPSTIVQLPMVRPTDRRGAA